MILCVHCSVKFVYTLQEKLIRYMEVSSYWTRLCNHFVDGRGESMVKLRAVLVYLEYAEEDHHRRRRIKSIRALVVTEQRTQRFVHSVNNHKEFWFVKIVLKKTCPNTL